MVIGVGITVRGDVVTGLPTLNMRGLEILRGVKLSFCED